MTRTIGGRAAIVAFGFAIGLAGLSLAGQANAQQADNAAATAQSSPADAQQAAPAADRASDAAASQDDVKQPVIVTQQQAETPAVRANPVVAGSQNASWDETTLIGKLFIGFGALLTVASAARMFMA